MKVTDMFEIDTSSAAILKAGVTSALVLPPFIPQPLPEETGSTEEAESLPVTQPTPSLVVVPSTFQPQSRNIYVFSGKVSHAPVKVFSLTIFFSHHTDTTRAHTSHHLYCIHYTTRRHWSVTCIRSCGLYSSYMECGGRALCSDITTGCCCRISCNI